jgi:C4-dicarboxylate transporter DctQ subunit
MNNLLRKFVDTIVAISKAIAAFGIAAGVALAFVNVVGRYIFHSSFTWAGELTIYLFLWSTFFGAVYCFKKDAHIAVDVLLAKATPKIARFLTMISLLIAFVYVSAIAYYGYGYVQLYRDLDEISIDLNIPMWIPYVVIPISFAFSAIVLIYKFIETLKTPADSFKIKSEAEELLEEFEVEDLVKSAERKSGGML